MRSLQALLEFKPSDRLLKSGAVVFDDQELHRKKIHFRCQPYFGPVLSGIALLGEMQRFNFSQRRIEALAAD